jgi:DNA-binding PadR family transcriptional regulator
MTEDEDADSPAQNCESQGWRRGRHGCDKGRNRDLRGIGARPARILAQGDLRLIALALLAEQPRHGYDIIKVVEERAAGWYTPSAGVIYPTLTFLEEIGHIVSQPEGAKRLYTINSDGRAHLAVHRHATDAIFQRLAAIGAKFGPVQRQTDLTNDLARSDGLTRLLRASIDNVRDLAADRIAEDPDAEAELVAILARVAMSLRKPSQPASIT